MLESHTEAEIDLSYSQKIRVGVLALLAFGASFNLCAQTPGLIWRNDWTSQQPPSLGPYYDIPYSSYQRQDPFAVSSDGELLMRTPALSGQDDEITRFTAAGAVRWHVNLGSLAAATEPGYGAMLGNSDGSAIVWAQAGSAVVKIGAEGSLQWSQLLNASSMAPLGSQAVAVLSCNRVYALDMQSGQVLWTLTLTPQTGNCNTSLISDAAGNGYASLYNNTANGSAVQLFKFSPGGQLTWQRSDSTSGNSPALFGVGATLVYSAAPAGMQAFSTADGTSAWTAVGARGLCMAGTPAEPVVVVGSDVQRLAEADGQPRWHQTVTSAQFASGSSSRVLVDGVALDADSGAPLWHAALPSTDQDGSTITYLNSGFMSDGSAMFGGYAFNTSGRPFLVRADSTSGQLLSSPLILPRTQSLVSNGVRVDATTIARAAVTAAPNGFDLHVRAVDTDSGTARWNTHELLDFYAGFDASTGIAAGGGTIAVTVASQSAGWIGAFDRTYGYKGWEKLLYLNFSGGGFSPLALYDPVVDGSGNVFVSYGVLIFCPVPISINYSMCKQLSVVKLGPDGSTLWQHDDVFPYFNEQIFAGSLTLTGNDIVVNSDFNAPYGANSLLKLSGADGTVLWGSPVFRQNGNQVGGVFVEPDDGNLIVTGPGWAKIDSVTGTTLWSNPPGNGCGQFCYAFNPLVLDDGSLLSAAQDKQRMWLILLPARAGATAMTWHPDLADTRVTSSFATTPFRDSAGDVWLRTGKRYGKSDAVFYLSRFDMQSGTLTSQQAMTLYGNDPLLSWASPWLLAAPEGGRLPVAMDSNQAPAPFTWGDAMLDSTIVAVGNFGVQIFADRSYAVPGDVLNFHVVASYTGSAPITGARVLFDFTWPGHATGLSCTTQAASNCVIDARAGAMTATFDVQSGGQIDISGQLRVGVSSNPQLHALIAGPIGLNELDTSDNGVSLLIDQSIFRDGFE